MVTQPLAMVAPVALDISMAFCTVAEALGLFTLTVIDESDEPLPSTERV